MTRARAARDGGYLPPPLEKDCPLRPKDGLCQLCRRPGTPRRNAVEPDGLHMDHDHITGKFRGWLCYRCNTMLGNLEALGTEALKMIAAYLK